MCFYVVLVIIAFSRCGPNRGSSGKAHRGATQECKQKQGRSTKNVVLRAFWFDLPRFAL